MSRFRRRTSKRVKKIARQQTDRFDSEILSNSVYDEILQDDTLHRIVEAINELDELQSEQYDTSTVEQTGLCDALRRGRYELEQLDAVDLRVEEVVDTAFEDIGESIDEWDDDVWTDEAKRAATAEIRAFWDDDGDKGGEE
jgi:hypothetical protein